MSDFFGEIKGNPVAIKLGDITRSQVDAIVVPEFNSSASYGGVARSGALKGMEQFDEFVSEKGHQPFGAVLFRFSWKWRRRSSTKVKERTHEEATEALHARREGRHPEAALAGERAHLEVVR
jgi:hypothetical protein